MFYSVEVVVALALAVIVLRSTWNFLRVRSVPGPFLASCSSLWQLYFKRTGRLLQKLDSLHTKYGPVVRYAPNTVSVSDAAAVSQVFGWHPLWNKAESYHPMIGINNGKMVPSMISVMSEARHTALRRPISPAFTNKAVLAYEAFIDQTIDELIESLSRLGTCDLSRWMQYLTMDVLSRVAFSETLGFVTKGEDIGRTMLTIEERFGHWNSWSAIPSLEWLIYKNPLYSKIAGSTSPLTALAATKLQQRTTGQTSKSHHDLLQSYIEASEANPDAIDNLAIMGLTMSTIAAGADTTAITLAAAIFYLLKNPATFEKLKTEIRSVTGQGPHSEWPKFSAYAKLPYLDAVIKETMRCWPIFTAPLERVVPPGGLEVAGRHLPEGTVVGCHQTIIHMDRNCYGADAAHFNPDRWLNASEDKRREMDRASLWFGSGKHICIGRHIAMLEMKKLIPRLIETFKMTLVDPSTELKSKINSVAYLEPIPMTFERI